MNKHAEEFPVEVMSRTLGVSRSGYYRSCEAPHGERAVQNEQLGKEIVRIHQESRGHYGSPRMIIALKKQGFSCGRNRVARIMRAEGLEGVRQPRKRVKTTDSNHGHKASPNLIKGLEITAPNQVWVADITYIRVAGKWVYLAAVLDLFSRKIVGWNIADNLKASLVVGALKQALATREWKPGLIHHSDQGVQYASHEFRQLLEDRGIEQSMSAKGNCYDNATMESFFGTIKAEEIEAYDDEQSARLAIFDYIETYYNRTRIHTSLDGGNSPEEFEALHASLEHNPAPQEPSQPMTPPTTQPLPSHEFSEASDGLLVDGSKKEQEPAESQNSTGSHDQKSHHPEYPSEGCSPAEPSSVSSRRKQKTLTSYLHNQKE